MNHEDLKATAEFAALRNTAARLGRDPNQIQGPGGNVSLKNGGAMWIKASGTWLADAERDEIFTPVNHEALKAALIANDPSADKPEMFLSGEGLKPSIETSFHAALKAPVVLHTHCVSTIARSIAGRVDMVSDLGLVEIPYAMPGAHLARKLLDAWEPRTRGAILVNHGLIATGATVSQAVALVDEVARRLASDSVPVADPDPRLASALEGTGWEPLDSGATTALAFDDQYLEIAAGNPLFPDQVIFLGPAPQIVEPGATIAQVGSPISKLAILRGLGAAVAPDSSPATFALAEMLGEVVFRIPLGSTQRRLSNNDVSDLLGWDAEKYRQALERARTERLLNGTAP